MRAPGEKTMRRSAGRAVVVAVLAALAVVLVPAGSAKPPPPPSGTYQVCLTAGTGSAACTATAGGGDYSILSGTHPELQVTITNDGSSNQTLDYANLAVPAGIGVAIDTAGSASALNYAAFASTSTSSTLQLRGLGLAPGASQEIAFFVNSSASSCTDGSWTTLAQSSSTPSAFVFTNPPSASSGLTSLVAVDCKLVFQSEPAPALPNATITSAAYTPTVGGGVHNVTVVARDAGGNALPVTLNGGNVMLAATAGAFDDPLNSTFTGTSGSFSQSSAVFAGLKATGTGGLFTLTASAGGFANVDSSPPFAITLNGTACDSGKSCTLTGTDASGKTTLTQIVTSAGFGYVGASPLNVPTPVPLGCQTWSPTPGVSGFVEFDGRTSSGTMNITYYVSQSAIKARYGKNTGQQFLPMCFGAKPVVGNQAVDCTTAGAPVPWTGDELDSSGAFTGKTAPSVCGPDGYDWGIISSYQDKLDQTLNPVVTGWGGPTNIGQNFRSFVISLPSGWDARGGM